MRITSIKGSAVGKYCVEFIDVIYNQIALVYIGTANNSYGVNFTAVGSTKDNGTDDYYLRNNSNSAGSYTISGTFYV
jgi:hypothetical protein